MREVVRRLLAEFLYHALYLIIYIGYEIGIAQHLDVVVKTKHEAANAWIASHVGRENPMVGIVGWGDVGLCHGVLF